MEGQGEGLTPLPRATPSIRLSQLVRKRADEGQSFTPEELFSSEGSHFDSWLSAQKSGELTYWQYLFGMHDGVRGRGGSKLIHPLSPFFVGLNVVSSLVIVYFFFEMPVLLAFFWNAPDCFRAATLEIDMAAEIFFMLEILLQFVTGVYDESNYFDTMGAVAVKYFRGLLLFDMLTATPVSWIEFAILHSSTICQDPDGDVSSGYSSYLYAKVPIRMLRPLRLIKIIKLFRIVRLFMMVEGQIRMELWLQKALQLLFTVVFVIHIFCCSFWVIKEVWEEDMSFFLDENGVKDADVVGKYILSGYFVNTVFTTVGFGDMHGENSVERLFVILMMWSGTICFAVVVSEMQDMVSKFNARNYSRRERVDTCRHFLRSHNSPKALERDIIDWVQFSFMVEQDRLDKQNLLDALPRDLQERLALHLNKGVLETVPTFNKIKSGHKMKFLASLAIEVEYRLFRNGETVATMAQVLDKMFMIDTGKVKVVASHGHGNHERNLAVITTLYAGDYFGYLNTTVSKIRLETQHVFFVAEGHVELSYLTSESFQHVLNHAPLELRGEVETLLVEQDIFTDLGNMGGHNAEVGFSHSVSNHQSRDSTQPQPSSDHQGSSRSRRDPRSHKSMSWVNVIPEQRVPDCHGSAAAAQDGAAEVASSPGAPQGDGKGHWGTERNARIPSQGGLERAHSTEFMTPESHRSITKWGSWSQFEPRERVKTLPQDGSAVDALRTEMNTTIKGLDKKMDLLFRKLEEMSESMMPLPRTVSLEEQRDRIPLQEPDLTEAESWMPFGMYSEVMAQPGAHAGEGLRDQYRPGSINVQVVHPQLDGFGNNGYHNPPPNHFPSRQPASGTAIHSGGKKEDAGNQILTEQNLAESVAMGVAAAVPNARLFHTPGGISG